MDTLALVKGYLIMNALIALCAGLLILLRRAANHLTYAHQLRFAYVLLAACALLPLIPTVCQPISFIEPTSQIFTAPSMRAPSAHFAGPSALTISMTPHSAPADPGLAPLILALICAIGAGTALTVFMKSFAKVAAISRHACVIRRIGSVKILASERIMSPFSFWCPGQNIVVIPAVMAADMQRLRIAVAHELQHHRQRDTRWVYVIACFKALCFWNPFSYVIARATSELQEFACDEALAGHRGISSSAYCRCLLWVAEYTLGSNRPLSGTASMASGSAGHILKRRIRIMMTSRNESVTKRSALKFGTLAISALTMLASVAMVANASIQDRRITLEDAEVMAAKVKKESDFPVVVNEEVLAQLNRYLGTPDGRDFIRRALDRKEKYHPVLNAALAKYKMPSELLALPIVESGYRNIAQGSNSRHGAGIWMFIKPTARNFGLRVDDEVDERLNVAKETDAAMRYLASLNLRFTDWGLALLAYNAGEGFVQRAIKETGSRDVWHLVRNRYENDPEYMAKVMAAILIMKNPDRLQ